MDLGLKGRNALVTGASKGIGKAIARGLADEGVNLVLLARGVEELERAAAEIRKATGVRVVTVPTDMRDTAAVKAAADARPANSRPFTSLSTTPADRSSVRNGRSPGQTPTGWTT